MEWDEAGKWVGAAMIVAALFLFPRLFSFRHRAIAGPVLLGLGWVGVFVGLALGNQPFMQSEAVALAWGGLSTLAIMLAITLIVPVFREWRRKRRKLRYKREGWRAGHWDS